MTRLQETEESGIGIEREIRRQKTNMCVYPNTSSLLHPSPFLSSRGSLEDCISPCVVLCGTEYNASSKVLVVQAAYAFHAVAFQENYNRSSILIELNPNDTMDTSLQIWMSTHTIVPVRSGSVWFGSQSVSHV